jgi:methionine-rich copper-binding protein CopC
MKRNPPKRTHALGLSAALLLAIALLQSPAASAHAALKNSEPAEGAVLTQSPESVVLVFDEAATLTALDIHRQNEPPRRVGPLPGGSSDRFVIPIARLAPGNYTLQYRVLSDDGHIVVGSIKFTLAPSAGQVAPAAGQ